MSQRLQPYDVLRVVMMQRACHHQRARRRRAVRLALRLALLLRAPLLRANLRLTPRDEGGGGARIRDAGCGERRVAAEHAVAIVLRLTHLVRLRFRVKV